MPADWSRYVGLAIATLLLIYLIARCVQSSRTGAFHFGRGTRVHRDDNPKDFAFLARAQIAGTLLFLAVYVYVLYDKFAADFGWIER
jgi:hypothetical protein